MNKLIILIAILSTIITSCNNSSVDIITIDTHIDIDVKNFTDSLNYTMNTDTQFNLPNMMEGELDVAWLVVYTAQGELNEEGYEAAYENAISKFDAINRFVNVFAPDQVELALTSNEVRRIHAEGKKVIMIGVENAYSMGVDTSNVRKFWEKGARYISLSHNGHSQFSDSNTGEFDGTALHNGLSDLGKEVIELLNYYGIMISLALLVSLAIRTGWNVLPAMNATGTQLWDMTGGSDPWYMKRVIDYVVAERSHFIFDSDRAYPMGVINHLSKCLLWQLRRKILMVYLPMPL